MEQDRKKFKNSKDKKWSPKKKKQPPVFEKAPLPTLPPFPSEGELIEFVIITSRGEKKTVKATVVSSSPSEGELLVKSSDFGVIPMQRIVPETVDIKKIRDSQKRGHLRIIYHELKALNCDRTEFISARHYFMTKLIPPNLAEKVQIADLKYKSFGFWTRKEMIAPFVALSEKFPSIRFELTELVDTGDVVIKRYFYGGKEVNASDIQRGNI